MKKFQNFLSEAQNHKPVVFAFGRMNPPTSGHAKLVDKVHSLAQKHDAHHEVVLSHSHDAEKNPLSGSDKLKHAKRFFPQTNISLSSKEHPNFISHAKRLSQAGHKHLIMVAGSDRVKEYRDTLHKYNGKEFHFKKIDVVSAGHRDPDAHGTEGMSASKMRDHAKKGNFKEFRKGIPDHVADHHAQELFHDVRRGMGIKHKGKVNEAELLDKHTLTTAEIAKKHGVSQETIEKQLEIGVGVEHEHTKNTALAREIALDHIGERPDYYTRLKKYVEDKLHIGSLIETAHGMGKIVSFRSRGDAVVCNIMESGQMVVIPLSEAVSNHKTAIPLQINKTRQSNFYQSKHMNEDVENRLSLLAEETGAPIENVKSAYTAGVASFRMGVIPGTNPQQWGLSNAAKFARSYVSESYDEKASVETSLKSFSAGHLLDLHKAAHGKPYEGTSKSELIARLSKKITSADHFDKLSKRVESFKRKEKELENTRAKLRTESIDTMFESHLLGTPAATHAFQSMTPGEPGYVGPNKELSIVTNTRDEHNIESPEEACGNTDDDRNMGRIRTSRSKLPSNDITKKVREVQTEEPQGKKGKKEETDYDSRLAGSPSASGGLSIQESQLPDDREIVSWAMNSNVQNMFIERYGAFATDKLLEAASKFAKNGKSISKFRKIKKEEPGCEGPPVTGYGKQALNEKP